VQELSAEEHQVLQELYHRTPDAAIKTRCQIILLSAKPMSVPQIAQITFYSEDTVARCIHEFNQRRMACLLPGPKGGRPPKITPDYLKRLLSIIEQDPRTLGCAFSNWTAPMPGCIPGTRDGAVFRRESHSSLRGPAHGYELLRPVLTVASPDPEYDSKRTRIEELQR
jgi:hypothetical protein